MSAEQATRPWMPFWTLLRKEVMRWGVAPVQTLLTPVVTSSLYLFIFGLSLGDRIVVGTGIGYLQFIVPGLVLMTVLSNAFTNGSFALFFSRYLGHIVDLLVTPLSPTQLILAYTLASMLRGMLVGGVVLGVGLCFTSLPWDSPFAAFAMAILASFQLSQLGLIAGLYSESFEAISMYTTFLLTPLIYLGGLFYPISVLPPFWEKLSRFNPLFYTIDGFRHALLGRGDCSLSFSFAVTASVSLFLFSWAGWLIAKGYRLRR